MNAETLLTRCRSLGVTILPTPQGKLRVTPPGRLPDDLKEELRKRKVEVLAVLNRHPLYYQAAETVADDCWMIDPSWLVDNQPDLWQRLCWLDCQASEFERRGETRAAYQRVLERIVATVKEARELYEQTTSKEEMAS